MSIFEGLSPENLRIAAQVAKNSPQGLAAVAIVGVVAVLAIGFVAAFAARHIGGFYAHVEDEEERLAREEREELEAQTLSGEAGTAKAPDPDGE